MIKLFFQFRMYVTARSMWLPFSVSCALRQRRKPGTARSTESLSPTMPTFLEVDSVFLQHLAVSKATAPALLSQFVLLVCGNPGIVTEPLSYLHNCVAKCLHFSNDSFHSRVKRLHFLSIIMEQLVADYQPPLDT